MSTANHNILYFLCIPRISFLNKGVCLWKALTALGSAGFRKRHCPNTGATPEPGRIPSSSLTLVLPETGGKAQKWCILTSALCEMWRFGTARRRLDGEAAIAVTPQTVSSSESSADVAPARFGSRPARVHRTPHVSPPQTGVSPPGLNQRICRWRGVGPEFERHPPVDPGSDLFDASPRHWMCTLQSDRCPFLPRVKR